MKQADWHWIAVLLMVFSLPITLWGESQLPEEQQSGAFLRREVQSEFDDVVFNLKSAIAGQNFRITGENRIGAGLRSRNFKDFPRYTVIHFCNLQLAREGLLVDMRLGAVMPCRLAVYEEGDHVVVLMPSAATVVAPLKNPELEGFRKKLDAVFKAVLEEGAY